MEVDVYEVQLNAAKIRRLDAFGDQTRGYKFFTGRTDTVRLPVC